MNDNVYTIDEIKKIITPIAKTYGIQKLFLFGSYARGEATPTSDIDFYIVSDSIKNLFVLGGLFADLEEALSKSIDLVTENSMKYNTDTRFFENIQKDRLLIYDDMSLAEDRTTDENPTEYETPIQSM